MGVENCGHPVPATEVTKLRKMYLECGRNMAEVSRASGRHENTIRRLCRDNDWDGWCDKVGTKADEMAVVPQAKRIVTILKLYDDRLEAIKDAAKSPEVQGSVAREISEIAKSSQLLTGGATGRVDIRAALKEFELLPIDEQRKLLEERGVDDSSG